MKNEEIHLDVFKDRSELHADGNVYVFKEGEQDSETAVRYEYLKSVLDNGFLEQLYENNMTYDFKFLDDRSKILIDNLTAGITSEVGRALTGLAFLQLTIKSIIPKQSIRLHKGGGRSGVFSWVKGISMRTIDSNYSTPFLREHNLLNINKYGIMMTRSLAENYPYSLLYKAEMRGLFNEWINIVDSLENGTMSPIVSLNYLLSVLRNRSNAIVKLADKACSLVESLPEKSFECIENLLVAFYNNTRYSARAFEIVIHCFMQAYVEMDFTSYTLVPLSQMRSANKKHGNIGDIEMVDGEIIVESWDAKYGKPYLLDELDELQDKIELSPGVKIAGFIVDKDASRKIEINEKIEYLMAFGGVSVFIFNFTDWVNYKIKDVPNSKLSAFGRKWITAVVESFARKRLDSAPIDEPCDVWLQDLISALTCNN